MDCRGRGGEAALEDLQGESDIPPACLVSRREALRAIHLFAHVGGDRLIQGGFTVAQLVQCSVGAPLREQRAAIDPEQLLLGQASQHVARIALVHMVAETALEAVGVEQGHEELEVFLLAVVRRRRHEKEVATTSAEQLSEPIALRVPDLRAEIARRHSVRFVAHDQIPLLRSFEEALEVFISAQHVEPDDQTIRIVEGVPGARGFDSIASQQIEGQVELRSELVLPLLHQAARHDNEAALQVTSDQKFLDEQSRHDGLACSWIVGEQEAQRLAGQHLFIDGSDLVRQGFDTRSVDREIGIEEVSKPDAVCFRNQPQQVAVCIEESLRAMI